MYPFPKNRRFLPLQKAICLPCVEFLLRFVGLDPFPTLNPPPSVGLRRTGKPSTTSMIAPSPAHCMCARKNRVGSPSPAPRECNPERIVSLSPALDRQEKRGGGPTLGKHRIRPPTLKAIAPAPSTPANPTVTSRPANRFIFAPSCLRC
jgi:hypothetical protein